MFKPFLLLPVCVAVFVVIVSPSLNAGFVPPKSNDLSIKSLKEENPELWAALGLDALGDDEVVLHLADNADELVAEVLQEVINSLPQDNLILEDIVDPLADNSGNQPASMIAVNIGRRLAASNFGTLPLSIEDSTLDLDFSMHDVPENSGQRALQLWSPQTAFQYYAESASRYYRQIRQAVMEPLGRHYNQARNYLQRMVGYCDRFFGQYCPSLFYNPMFFVGGGPAIDPTTFPARWLRVREIRDHLLQQWIRINNRYFMSRVRNFNNLRLPGQLNWQHVVMRGFSFREAILPEHTLNYCQLVDTNLEGTQFYRCRISCSEIKGVQANLQTELVTSTFQQCATQGTITTLLAVTGANSREDTSWQGMVNRMINLYFISQLQQHVLLQQMVAAITSGQVGLFLEHSRELIDLHPDLFSVALQVLYILSMQNETLARYRPDIQMLMSHHVSRALGALSSCYQSADKETVVRTPVAMRKIEWPETPVALESHQLDYQNNLMAYFHQNELQPITMPKDDQCFYHVLAQHAAGSNPNLSEQDKKKWAGLLRQMIASYLFVYMNNYFAQDGTSESISVDESMQIKMNVLDSILEQGLIDLGELLDTAAAAASPSGWAGQTTGMVAAIVMNQPVFMVNDHGANVHVSLMYPNGTSVSDEAVEAASQSGTVENVIPMAFDSINHWFTMVGAMLQTWVVLQARSVK